MNKYLYDLIRNTDVSVDGDILEEQKRHWKRRFDTIEHLKIYEDEKLSRQETDYVDFITESPNLKCEKEHGYIRFNEYIKQNKSLLSTGIFSKNTGGIKWIQNVREHAPYEKKFMRQVRKFHNGKHMEILNSIFIYKNKDVKKYFATSGMPCQIQPEDISASLASIKSWQDLRNQLETVILIHNHRDRFKDIFVSNLKRQEFLSHFLYSGISTGDVRYINSFHKKKLKEKVPAIMVAVCENGYTYMCKAGDSKSVENSDNSKK